MEYKIDINSSEIRLSKSFLGKEYLQLNNGSVKIVKVEPKAFYPIHVHPNKTEYAFVVIGNPEFLIGDKTYFSNAGVLFISP